MSDAWWFIAGVGVSCIVWALARGAERVYRRRHPPRDTAELLDRISAVAHPLIEARLAVAWHEGELAKVIDNVPPVFEDQVMLAAQLGQAIEQSVMREVQRQGLPVVRLQGGPTVSYNGWMAKWLKRKPEVVDAVSADPSIPPPPPKLLEEGTPSVPPPPTRPTTILPPSSNGPLMIHRPGVGWVPRRSSL